MIFADRIEVLRRVVVGTDSYGNDVTEDAVTVYPAEVRPMSSQEPINGPVTTRYRIFLPASATDVTAADAVRWRGRTLELRVQPHSIGGRLHHHEVIARLAS